MNDTTVAAAVDLSDTLPVDTATLCTVKPGTNIRTGWNVTFAGPGHPQRVALTNEKERERLHKAAQIERSQVNGRKWKGEDQQPDLARYQFISDLVAQIVSWTPVNFGDGEVRYDEGDKTAPARAVDLLMKPKLGVYVGQFVDFLLDERTFTKDSAIS